MFRSIRLPSLLLAFTGAAFAQEAKPFQARALFFVLLRGVVLLRFQLVLLALPAIALGFPALFQRRHLAGEALDAGGEFGVAAAGRVQFAVELFELRADPLGLEQRSELRLPRHRDDRGPGLSRW